MTALSGGPEQKTRRRSSRRRGSGRARRPRLVWLRNLRLAIAVYPRRSAAFLAAGLLLIGIIATTSLPMALADRHPELALLLHPGHPQALLALARAERQAIADLPALAEGEGPPAETGDPTESMPADAATAAPPVEGGPEPTPADGATAEAPAPTPAEIAAHRATIRDLAARVIERAPLNASAFRMRGDASDDLDTSRQAMIESIARSRRETVAAFWLLHHDYERRDYQGVMRMADVLLQTRPALNRYTLSYLDSLILTPEGRDALAAVLIRQPSWRWLFFATLGRQLAASDAPLALFLQLKEAGSPPTERELVPFLQARMAVKGGIPQAYNIWLQLLPAEELLKVRPVNNLDFAGNPSALPFNWNIPRSTNAFVDFMPRPAGEQGRILRVRFGVGQVKFGNVYQIGFLRPGTYRFSGQQRGAMSAKRGMRWQVLCYPQGPVTGQSDQLLGSPRQWRDFTFDFTVPDAPHCQAQLVRLIHDARSTSERFASGDIQFQSLDIAPVDPTAEAPGG